MIATPTQPAAARARVVFFGSPAFAVPSLERLVGTGAKLVAVVTQPDRPAGRGQALTEPAVKQAARRLAASVPVLQPEKIRTGELEQQLRDLRADLFIVVAYGRILPQTILDLPPLGPWNVHASVLPRLRGAAPIQWAIINGMSETGVSIMRMEAGLDTGPVARVATMPISDEDTAGTLATRLADVGAELLAATLPPIVARTVTLAAQDGTQATLAPLLRKEDGRLDFTRSARVVSARARGVDPWPGATSLLDGQPVRLFGARATDGLSTAADTGAAGTIGAVDGDGVHVVCGEGAIRFAEVQLPGRKRLPAAVAAAGRALAVGMRFA